MEHLPRQFSGEYNGSACSESDRVCGKSMCEVEIMYCHPVGLLQGCCGSTHLCVVQLLWWKSRINKDIALYRTQSAWYFP